MTPAADIAIRPAEARDVPDMIRLLRVLAANEGHPQAVKATERSLTQALFGPRAGVFGHVAEREGAVIGIAIWFETFSTWTRGPGLYLEDLIVDDAARGGGVGRRLFAAVAKAAVARGCERIDWAVLDGNPGARPFYQAIGAFHSTGWEPWRIEGEALSVLAASA